MSARADAEASSQQAAAETPINENLVIRTSGSESSVVCTHCDHVICDASETIEDHLAHYEGEPAEGGPLSWPTPGDYVDRKVTFQQSYCPSCFTLLVTRILPTDRPALRDHVVPTEPMEG